MNRRSYSPLLAGLVVLVTLWVITLFYGLGWESLCGWSAECGIGGCDVCQPTRPGYLAGSAVWFVGILVLLGGFWCAWRIGTGHWTLRRRPAPSPSSPPA